MIGSGVLTVWLVVKVIGGMALAAVLHELTHAAAAVKLGAVSGQVNLLDLSVEYEMPAEAPLWRDRLINLSPQIVGTAGAALFVVVFGLPAASVASVPLVASWAVYTVFGGAEDFSLALAHGGGPGWTMQEKRVFGSAGCLAVALAWGLATSAVSLPVRAVPIARSIYFAMLFSTLVLLVWGVSDEIDEWDPEVWAAAKSNVRDALPRLPGSATR